jgi:hypothetical protein
VKICSKLLRLIRPTPTVSVNLGLVYACYTLVLSRCCGLLDIYGPRLASSPEGNVSLPSASGMGAASLLPRANQCPRQATGDWFSRHTGRPHRCQNGCLTFVLRNSSSAYRCKPHANHTGLSSSYNRGARSYYDCGL